MRLSNELQIGKAGEYLACADLVMKGLVAFPSEQGLPYDVLVDTGKRLLRVQVKTTTAPRIIPQRAKDSYAYIFNVKRCGKNGTQRYEGGEIDIFSLVCLDTRQVGYLLNGDMPETLNLRVDSLRGTYYDEKGIKDHENIIDLFSSGLSRRDISAKTGVPYTTVSRMIQDGYEPFKTEARYFSEIQRSQEWFMTI